MITREQIHELAQFEDEGACALSFYFQPTTPRNKAHKEEAILTKDLAREVLRQLESRDFEGKTKTKTKNKCESARADLDRIVRLSQDLRGNGAHAKAVFACSAQKFWREYDLPAHLSGTQLLVDRHFHLKPLTQLLASLPSLGIVIDVKQFNVVVDHARQNCFCYIHDFASLPAAHGAEADQMSVKVATTGALDGLRVVALPDQQSLHFAGFKRAQHAAQSSDAAAAASRLAEGFSNRFGATFFLRVGEKSFSVGTDFIAAHVGNLGGETAQQLLRSISM